ncbi:hypothetical protein ACJX0J_024793, partial [Zea mays]
MPLKGVLFLHLRLVYNTSTTRKKHFTLQIIYINRNIYLLIQTSQIILLARFEISNYFQLQKNESNNIQLFGPNPWLLTRTRRFVSLALHILSGGIILGREVEREFYL